MKPKIYYEVHITLDPVEDDRLDRLKELATYSKFKVAELLYRKGTPSRDDPFCSSRGTDFMEVLVRMREFISDLKEDGFKIRRYKIEDVVVDSKISDAYKLL